MWTSVVWTQSFYILDTWTVKLRINFNNNGFPLSIEIHYNTLAWEKRIFDFTLSTFWHRNRSRLLEVLMNYHHRGFAKARKTAEIRNSLKVLPHPTLYHLSVGGLIWFELTSIRKSSVILLSLYFNQSKAL